MHMTQCQVAVRGRIYQDTESDQIVDLAKIRLLQALDTPIITNGAFELFIETIQMFYSPGNLCFQAQLAHLVAQDLTYSLDIGAPLLAFGLNHAVQPGVFLWLQHSEGHIFQLALQTRHAQTPGQGRVNFLGLARHVLHFLVIHNIGLVVSYAHCVQAIGQLQQHHTRIFRHRKKHFAHRFGLLTAHGLANALLFRLAVLIRFGQVGLSLGHTLFFALQDIQAQHTIHHTSHSHA